MFSKKVWPVFALGVVLLCQVMFAQEWVPAQSGWLYVLDVGGSTGQILMVDPSSGSVKGVLLTGYHPTFGLCPGGSRLYVVDGPQGQGELSTFDTATGMVGAKIPMINREVYGVRPTGVGIGCSSSGKWLFVQNMRTISPGVHEHTLLVINAVTGEISDQTMPLPGCGVASFLPWQFDEWDMVIQCSSSNSLRFVRLNSNGHLVKAKDVALTLATPQPLADNSFIGMGQRVTTSALIVNDRRSIAVFRAGGGLDEVETAAFTIQPKIIDDWQRWLLFGSVAFSPDSQLAYVGFKPFGERINGGGLMNSISVMKTSDWSETAVLRTTLPFSSLTASNNGKTVYAVNTEVKSVTVIDGLAPKEIRIIPNIGTKPALVLLQP